MGLKTSTKVIGVISCFTGWAGAGGAYVTLSHPWSDLVFWPLFLCVGMAHVVIAIKKDFEVLSSSNASQAKKLGSLKFLGHWVGDIHQPLHVSFEDDRGGNNVLVTGECGSNLHSAWDTCLVLKAVGEDVGEAATELMKTITPAKIESWTHSDPKDWANESFTIAEQAQTKYCIQQGASCDQPSGKVKIDAAYVAANTPIIREQLQKSGVRLAHLLDAALGK